MEEGRDFVNSSQLPRSPGSCKKPAKGNPMHIVVTGGAGYIGSTLVPTLLQAGHRVTVIDRLFFGENSLRRPLEAHPDQLRLVRADIRRVDPRVFEGTDGLVDLAGISNDPSCELDA